jgi:cyclopentanol dehydrogenase
MGRLENKVAIITGGASGIGAATAKLFAKEGAALVITDINEAKLKTVAEELIRAGGKVLSVKHDVSLEKDWLTVVNASIETFGKVSILFNNAGMVLRSCAWEDISLKDFQKILDVNLTSQFLGIRAVAANMIANGGGSIINMSSTAGLIATVAHPAYTASKGGSRLLTKAAAKEYARSNIRVNSIHPGFTNTELTAPYLESEQGRKDMQAENPMGRAGEAIEIATATLFLASDDSTFMTGAELVVDGGQTSV